MVVKYVRNDPSEPPILINNLLPALSLLSPNLGALSASVICRRATAQTDLRSPGAPGYKLSTSLWREKWAFFLGFKEHDTIALLG